MTRTRRLPLAFALACGWLQCASAQQVLPAPLQGGLPSEV